MILDLLYGLKLFILLGCNFASTHLRHFFSYCCTGTSLRLCYAPVDPQICPIFLTKRYMRLNNFIEHNYRVINPFIQYWEICVPFPFHLVWVLFDMETFYVPCSYGNIGVPKKQLITLNLWPCVCFFYLYKNKLWHHDSNKSKNQQKLQF